MALGATAVLYVQLLSLGAARSPPSAPSQAALHGHPSGHEAPWRAACWCFAFLAPSMEDGDADVLATLLCVIDDDPPVVARGRQMFFQVKLGVVRRDVDVSLQGTHDNLADREALLRAQLQNIQNLVVDVPPGFLATGRTHAAPAPPAQEPSVADEEEDEDEDEDVDDDDDDEALDEDEEEEEEDSAQDDSG